MKRLRTSLEINMIMHSVNKKTFPKKELSVKTVRDNGKKVLLYVGMYFFQFIT